MFCIRIIVLSSAIDSRLPSADYHLHSIPWPQRDQRPGLHFLAGKQPQLPVAGDRRDQQDAFHPREGLADADPRAASKRKIRKLRTRVSRFLGPAFGVEPERIEKEAGVVV